MTSCFFSRDVLWWGWKLWGSLYLDSDIPISAWWATMMCNMCCSSRSGNLSKIWATPEYLPRENIVKSHRILIGSQVWSISDAWQTRQPWPQKCVWCCSWTQCEKKFSKCPTSGWYIRRIYCQTNFQLLGKQVRMWTTLWSKIILNSLRS